MLNSTLRQKRAIGLVLLVVLLGLFLWFNRIPKLDTVQGEVAGVTATVVKCFQGFCPEGEPGASLLERWWDFSLSYFKLITWGMLFAFLVAGVTEVFLFPPDSHKPFAQGGIRGSLRSLFIGPALNLCSACIVPIANAFRSRGASIETTLSITQGSSTLNLPALIMAASVFTPLMASTRVGISLLGVILLGPLVARLAGRLEQGSDEITPLVLPDPPTPWRTLIITGFRDWAAASIGYLLRLGPIMVLAGLASGLAIQWISPESVQKYLGDDVAGVALAATFGLLINVPLLFEIPLVAALLLMGMGTAPAATLLFAAAAGGPFTFWGLAKVMPSRAVLTFAASTWGLGVAAGISVLLISSVLDSENAGLNPSHASPPQSSPTGQATEPLSVTDLTPGAASTLGEVMVTFTGTGFTDETVISIGGEDVTWQFLNSNTITAYLVPHETGTVDVVVSDPANDSQVLPGAFKFHPPFFIDVAEQSGADFLHYRDAGSLFTFGAGVVVLDFDSDGFQDIYVTSTQDILGFAETDGSNALYRNNGIGSFSNIAKAAGVSDLDGFGNGGCAADYDNDGDQDFFLANWGNSRLFQNNADGTFKNVASASGVSDPDFTYRTMGCAWGDYDRDGNLDLVMVRHIHEENLEAIRLRDFTTQVRPMALYRNNGDGTFSNQTFLLGDLTPNQRTLGPTYGNVWGTGFQPTWLDFDNDGDPDLYVVNDFGEFAEPNVLWRNDGPDGNGGWVFTDISTPSGTDSAIYGMGVAVGDYNLDGNLDLFLTNLGEAVLLSNNGDGSTFTGTGARTGIPLPVETGMFRDQLRVSWGTVFFDYDNDGDEDLYIASGFLDDDPFNNRSEQPNLLLRNDGEGGFTDVSNLSGAADWGISRGVAYADFDGDGCLDLYVTNMGASETRGERARLFQNRCDWDSNWLTVKLIGTESNRDGIGARITVTADGKTQIREVRAGSSSGSQNMLPAHFGLGGSVEVDSITIRWPSGTVQKVNNVASNQYLTVRECRSPC